MFKYVKQRSPLHTDNTYNIVELSKLGNIIVGQNSFQQ